jgi:hypothetical protein
MVSLKTLKVGFYLMNFLKNLATVATVLGAVTLAQSAQAASFKFIPAGSNLDTDGARDLVAAVGDVKTLQVVLDVVGGIDPDLQSGEIIKAANFGFGWDTTEIGSVSFTSALAGTITTFFNPTSVTVNALNITGPAASSTLMGTFTYTVLAGLVNDNSPIGTDLFLTTGTLSGINIDGLTPGLGRGIDVQPKDAVPTPALIPGIAAMGMGLLRRKKAQAVAA